MIANLQPYREYKESNHLWLGQLPRHWLLLPNRAIFAEVNDRDHPQEEMLSVTITHGIIRQKALLTNNSKKDSSRNDKSAYKLIQPQDIAYNKMRAWQGAIGVSYYRGIISPAYIVMRSREKSNLSRYFHYLFRTSDFAKEAERWSYGITSDMWSLRPEHFKLIYAPLPPPEEQAAIVRFLDWANGRLERAIRAKRKVISLLQEQKQAIIHRAVTRGLDPDVPLKPSGIPWLGDIPSQWEVLPLRRLAQQGRRITYGIVQPGDPVKGGRLMIRGQDYSRGWCNPDAIFRVSDDIERAYLRSRLIPQDIVMTIVGAGVGNTAIVPDWASGANITQTTARISIDSSKAFTPFINFVLTGPVGKRNVERYVYGAAQPRLNLPHVAAFQIPLPPLPEQVAISVHLQSRCEAEDVAIHRLEHEIALLREYRTRLVADVVTGKLDVREVARNLPVDSTYNEIESEPDDFAESDSEDVEL